jgi:Holliday junction DNA helicase RuvA
MLDVGGVGFVAFATPRLLADLRVGAQAQLAVAFVVREDALTLFAFPDDDEREVFETARSVTGIGPKTALALLAVHSADELRLAIENGDVKAIQKVPGIGSKTAQRVLLELGGKLVTTSESKATKGTGASASDRNKAQVIEALVGLGYQAKAAEAAVDDIVAAADSPIIADDEVPAILRAALRAFGAKR